MAGAVAVINLAGDYYLIIQKGLGVVGAGVTCPVAQYFGAIVFMVYLHRMGKREKGIPLSWQVKVTAQYCILYGILQGKLYFLPDTPRQVSCVSLPNCVPVLPAGTFQSAYQHMSRNRAFTVCCKKVKITRKLSRSFKCLESI